MLQTTYTFLNFVFINLVFALAIASIAYLIAILRNNRFDVIDVFWGVLIITVAAISYSLSESSSVHTIVLFMVLVWGLRLSTHLFMRFSRKKTQDPRYKHLMDKWPTNNRHIQAYFRIYVVQSILASIVALPVLVIMFKSPSFNTLTVIGVALWVFGFILESIADRQLSKFVSKPHNHNKIMDRGLWRYSRHPNYLGEMIMWWAIALIALSVPYGWIGILGALTITLMIRYVSGVPLAEKQNAHKEGWENYRRRTPAVLPKLSAKL